MVPSVPSPATVLVAPGSTPWVVIRRVGVEQGRILDEGFQTRVVRIDVLILPLGQREGAGILGFIGPGSGVRVRIGDATRSKTGGRAGEPATVDDSNRKRSPAAEVDSFGAGSGRPVPAGGA